MKKLNKIKIIFLIFMSFACNQKHSQNVDIQYLGFENFTNSSRMNLLFFQIENNSIDTLYLSNKNILIKVLKNNELLKNEETKLIGQPVFKPNAANKEKINKQFEQEKNTAYLKYTFAKKLFYKNFGQKYIRDREFIIKQIQNSCIVILPNESVNYAKIFNNRLFDKECKIKITYVNCKKFDYFIDDNGNEIDINY